MPPKFGGGEKCDVCSKTVYAAERQEAGGKIYHKFCFKCSVCNMQLKLNNYAQEAGVLYCKNDFAKSVTAQNTQAPVF